MIVAKEMPGRHFNDKQELFAALRENKRDIIATKKMSVKESDSVIYVPSVLNEKGESVKSQETNLLDIDKIHAKLVINTTLLMDSHSDVHLNGIWKKSVKETKSPYLLQEHKMTFDHIISDNVKASVEAISWKDLGFNYSGSTEALIFDATISKDRNEYMFNQYAKGFVKEHSVGMRYINIELGINSESKYDEEEKKVWDKYIDLVVNKDVAEEQGYAWFVHEAKIIEGSAVVKGSNFATPTISVEAAKSTSTKTEPSSDTQIFKKPARNSGLNSFIKNL